MDQVGGKGSILPLRASDLVFNRKSDGIMSCGYKISNALLNSTLNVQYGGGGGGGGSGHTHKERKTSEYDIKTAKLMEDLVVPSGLYYCHPITKHKVFNHKVSKQGKTDKKSKSHDSNDESGDNIDEDDVIDESLYDKLLELVSPESRRKYDKKTRKVRSTSAAVPKKSKIVKTDDTPLTGDNAKIKQQNKKTKKVRFVE
jgi:hypothetical protein